MIKIAIVEDEIEIQNQIQDFLVREFKNRNQEIEILKFSDGSEFLNIFDNNFDLIFMDINMPNTNGIEATKQIRKKDQDVIVFFVTSLAQYAMEGYEYNIFDFILKPLNEYDFKLKLNRAILHLDDRRDESLVLTGKGFIKKIKASDILYCEVVKHSIIYHTFKENIVVSDSLKKVYGKLEKLNFALCNQCYLVNLKYVDEIRDYTCFINGEELLISHPRKKEFLSKLNRYLNNIK